MRNMGRLFQYNRFGGNNNNDTDNNKKENYTQRCLKTKEHQQQYSPPPSPPPQQQRQFAANCPAYAELYPEYACNQTTTAAEAATDTTAANANVTMTTKSLELALRKYQQWSSKFLSTTTTTAAPATECITHLPTPTMTSSSQKSPNSCSLSTATSSGYQSRLAAIGSIEPTTAAWDVAQSDREELLVSDVGKRPKVYDCMKDFLRRKLFQQRHEQLQDEADTLEPHGKSDTEEDVTSDYDEVDMLDSSYNADEEDEASDCSSSCTCPLDSDTEQKCTARSSLSTSNDHSATPLKPLSPQKSLLSLNCWQHSAHYTDSTTEEDNSAAEDSDDAGISDCCQLINSEKSSPAKRSNTRKPRLRYNLQDGDLPELLQSSWYQPRITTKAALERLQQSTPGTFLVRRKSRAYELCLRAESKVKHYAVQEVAAAYRLKGAKKQFTTLKALVTHHSVMAEQLPLTLTLPREEEYTYSRGCTTFGARRPAKALRRYADDFDTYESLQLLGLLQQLQDEECNEFS